jgi:hypothetical protein
MSAGDRIIGTADDTNLATTIRRHWTSGPVGHRAGIAACLMQRLKFEIMDPMTRLQRGAKKHASNENEKGGNYSGNEASFISRNPLRSIRFRAEDSVRRSPPPAPWEVGRHDAEKDRAERIQEDDEFVYVYLNKRRLSISEASMKNNVAVIPPSSVLRFMDLPNVTSSAPVQQSTRYQAQSKLPIGRPPRTPNKPPPSYHAEEEEKEAEEEGERMDRLQREKSTLLASYQHSDMEGVQKVERSMVEITTLLSRFTDLISEQQDSIFTIHDNALKSKENIDKGQDNLVDSADRGQKSRHPMAAFIFMSALLLLLFNWITP